MLNNSSYYYKNVLLALTDILQWKINLYRTKGIKHGTKAIVIQILWFISLLFTPVVWLHPEFIQEHLTFNFLKEGELRGDGLARIKYYPEFSVLFPF